MKKLVFFCYLFSATTYATPVNINRADVETLAHSLQGVNIKKSEAIVANRIAYGDFHSLEDVKRVSGMGEKTLELNKNDILFTDKPIKTSSETAPSINNPQASPHVEIQPQNPITQIIVPLIIALILLGLGFVLYKRFKNNKPQWMKLTKE